MTYRDLVTNALRELNVLDASDAADAADAVFVLGKLNRIFDRWNALGVLSYVVQFYTPTLTPSLQPHTLGPTGVLLLAVRPEEILGAERFDGTIKTPIRIHDEEWWLRKSNPAQTGSFVTDLYYRPSWPNGELYFWPVPSSANAIQLMARVPFATGTLNTTFSLPPGFEDAVTLTLAEEIAEAFGATPGPKLMASGMSARAALLSKHAKRYPLRSDAGLGLGGRYGGTRGWYDYRIGPFG